MSLTRTFFNLTGQPTRLETVPSRVQERPSYSPTDHAESHEADADLGW